MTRFFPEGGLQRLREDSGVALMRRPVGAGDEASSLVLLPVAPDRAPGVAERLQREFAIRDRLDPGYRRDMLAALQRRELLRVAGQLADELGKPFVEAAGGARLEGTLRRPVDMMSGRFALVEKSREFTLVPWRPVLERHIGKQVSGVMRESGVSWTFGRQRAGPTIS